MNLTDLIPAKYMIYFYAACAAVLLGGFGFVYYKIDGAGYNRCEAKYEAAAATAQSNAQKQITELGKTYDAQKAKIYKQTGPDDPVGPRTRMALDGLRGPRPGK